MDGEVETHQLSELGVVEAEHVAVVGRPVLVVIDGTDALPVAVCVAVDGRRDHRQLGDQVHRVFVHVLGDSDRQILTCNLLCRSLYPSNVSKFIIG